MFAYSDVTKIIKKEYHMREKLPASAYLFLTAENVTYTTGKFKNLK